MQKENFIHSLKDFEWANLIGPIHSEIEVKSIKAAPTLFVDGGLNLKSKLNFSIDQYPSLSIGDGDSSISHEMDISYPAEKDQTDLQLALELLPDGLKIEAWGFSGERIDHYLANIGEFQRKTNLSNSIISLDKEMLFLPSGEFEIQFEGQFSLISTVPTELKLTGNVTYSVHESFKLDPLSGRGISNTSNGTFRVKTSDSIILIPVGKTCDDLKIS